MPIGNSALQKNHASLAKKESKNKTNSAPQIDE